MAARIIVNHISSEESDIASTGDEIGDFATRLAIGVERNAKKSGAADVSIWN